MSNHQSNSEQKKRLRSYLNPAIRGPRTDSVLEALSIGASHLISNIEAVNDMLYIVTAVDKYLDARMADRDLTRPDNVGLSDEVFRELGIEVSNRKQVRDLIGNILNIMYGDEFTKATLFSNEFEPYALEDGDTLKIQFDDGEVVEVIFDASQFTNISAATAQEVADAITKSLRKLGRTGSAISRNDGSGAYVVLMSETIGPSSTIRVFGGKAQNSLKFPAIRPTAGVALTQWTLSLVSGGKIRATWSGGPNPFIGKVKKDDYVNIYGTSFNLLNRGTFTISAVNGGLVTEAYVEFENPNGIAETILQGNDTAILFYQPQRATLASNFTYAAAYQTESRLLEIFMPATTKVIRRNRKGAAHLHESGSSNLDDTFGPYLYDESKPYLIGGEECNSTILVDSNTELIVTVDDSSQFPDDQGHLIFGFGTSKEEGPVPYISRPSNNSLMINPSYRFQNVHPIGTNISLVSQDYSYTVTKNGEDYPFYLTDVVSGRLYAEDLINTVAATGINVVITILYPNDIGLGKWNTENSEKYWVWGEDLE
ncbi:MAG TPA: hypothetical protein VI911_11420 [Patescibacteria group bacterium]|nr:hypothetical protein [Patescibacteria group bacterium]